MNCSPILEAAPAMPSAAIPFPADTATAAVGYQQVRFNAMKHGILSGTSINHIKPHQKPVDSMF
ncbi:MAG: hypothetical protein Q8M11_01415 [Sulfuritalea sp.]|nr:hypothetical protein [Sulfuritalea sp.]